MPLVNSNMKANRFLTWHRARKAAAAIKAHLTSGGIVQITTGTHCTQYTRKHVDLFRAGKDGLYVQHRRQWLYLGFNKITFH